VSLALREAADLPRCLTPRSCQNFVTGFFGRCDRLRDLLDEMQMGGVLSPSVLPNGHLAKVSDLGSCQIVTSSAAEPRLPSVPAI
jgi:hypothetical protein